MVVIQLDNGPSGRPVSANFKFQYDGDYEEFRGAVDALTIEALEHFAPGKGLELSHKFKLRSGSESIITPLGSPGSDKLRKLIELMNTKATILKLVYMPMSPNNFAQGSLKKLIDDSKGMGGASPLRGGGVRVAGKKKNKKRKSRHKSRHESRRKIKSKRRTKRKKRRSKYY